MYVSISFLLFAAEAAEVVDEAAKDGAKGGDSPAFNMFTMMIPVVVIFFVWQIMFGGNKKEKRRQAELLKSMKKNDRIITIGGLIGTVVSISNDGKEVTIRVDDNTRLKFLTNSIREVMSEKSKDDDDKNDSSKS